MAERIQVQQYILPPTKLIPNSAFPLLHYRSVFPANPQTQDLSKIHSLFASNGWHTQWIYRYGTTQRSHYHSGTHECMTVLSGHATIRFGVADTAEDLELNTHGDQRELGGIEVEAQVGDVFVIPAGLAHKTFNATPTADFALLTPNDAHSISTASGLAQVQLSGFTMMGAFPIDHAWDFAVGGEHGGSFDKVWAVPKPDRDPIYGLDADGLVGRWK